MRIAICDDEVAQLKLLESYVKAWGKEQKEVVEVCKYERAEHFLFQWEEQQNMDILLLDIEMPGMDGMTMAKKLREKKDSIQIIFISGNSEYALEGYEVEPVTYLLKPVSSEKLYAALNRAVGRIGRTEPVLLVEEAGGKVRIPVKEILYLESEGHDTMIKTENGIFRCKKGIQEMEQMLADVGAGTRGGFCRIHRSYLISMGAVLRITRKEVELQDYTRLPIARGKWEMVNQAYLAYYRREMEKMNE